MSDNIFHDAVVVEATTPKTHTVTTHPPFNQRAIDQARLAEQARNMTRQDMFNNGMLTVDDMDDEELRMGRMRNQNGKIPRVNKTMESVPRDLYDEMVAEHLRRTHEKYRQQLDVALTTFVEAMVDPSAEWKDRLDAAKYITERVAGKPRERVDVTVTKAPWEELLGDVAHITREQHLRLKEAPLDVEFTEVAENAAQAQEGDAGLGDELSHGPVASGPTTANPGARQGVRQEPYAGQESASGVVRAQTVEPQVDVPVQRHYPDDGPTGSGIERGRRGRGNDVDGLPAQPQFGVPTGPSSVPKAPRHDAPATSNPVAEVSLSQALAEAQAKAIAVMEARATRKKLVNDAKKRRIVQRTLGLDVLAKEIPAEAFGEAQDRLLNAMDDTGDVSSA